MESSKFNIELTLPILGVLNEQEIEETLHFQSKHLADTWRAILSIYKKEGIKVPTLSLKGTIKPKEDSVTVQEREFSKLLIDHHILQMPLDTNIASQRQTVKKLFVLGYTAEELIKLYEENRAKYPLTTWHTVRYHLLKNPKKESDATFERTILSDEAKNSIIARMKK